MIALLGNKSAHLCKTQESDDLQEGVKEAFPEDVGHEAVDEEVGGRVDHHRQLGKVAQQEDPERQVVAVVLQRCLELLDGEHLEQGSVLFQFHAWNPPQSLRLLVDWGSQ